jgi:hypothetical protein
MKPLRVESFIAFHRNLPKMQLPDSICLNAHKIKFNWELKENATSIITDWPFSGISKS